MGQEVTPENLQETVGALTFTAMAGPAPIEWTIRRKTAALWPFPIAVPTSTEIPRWIPPAASPISLCNSTFSLAKNTRYLTDFGK